MGNGPASDDYFGTSYIGLNPYQKDFTTQSSADTTPLNAPGGVQYAMGSESVTPPHAGAAPSPAADVNNSTKSALKDPSGGNLMDPAYMQSLLNYWQQQPGVNPSVINDPGYWTQKASQGAFGNDQAYLESRFMTPEGPPAGRAIAGQPFSYSGVNIQPDLQSLRTLISNNLANNFNSPAKTYGGNFNLGTPTGQNQLLSNATGMTGQIGDMMSPGLGALGGLLGFSGSSDLSPLYGPLAQLLGGGTAANINPYLSQGTSFLNSMMGPASGMAQSGGINAQVLQQLMPSLMGMGNNMLPGANSLMQGGIGAGLMQGGGGMLQGAGGIAQNIAQTGGAPIQQLLQSLQNIQTQGQTQITNNLADIREKYGMQGLGTGSDVNTALALGATQGQQGIEAQQSSLLTQILQQAAGTQLGGVNAMAGAGQGIAGIGGMFNQAQTSGLGALGTAGGLQLGGAQAALTGANNQSNAQLAAIQALLGGANAATSQGQLAVSNAGLQQQGMLGGLNAGMNILTTPFNQQLQSAQMQLNAAMGFPTFANSMTGAYGAANNALGGIGSLSQASNMYTNQGGYNDFLRTIGLTPQQQAAMGYSTQFAPVVPATPGAGTQLGAAGIAAGGSILGAMIPYLAMGMM